MVAMAIEERVDHGSGSLRVSAMDPTQVFSGTRPTVIAWKVAVWELFDITEFAVSGCG